MNVISVIIYAAELAVAAIILFYVVEMLTMPGNMKRVCQGLIILIAILSVTGVLLGSASTTGVTCRTACSKFTEQSQHYPVMHLEHKIKEAASAASLLSVGADGAGVTASRHRRPCRLVHHPLPCHHRRGPWCRLVHHPAPCRLLWAQRRL